VGSADGSIKIYNALSGKMLSNMVIPPPAERMPITAIKYFISFIKN